MNLEGKAVVVSEVINVTDSFKKRELVIKTDEQYPSEILIEFVQDKTDLLNAYKIGDNVKVSINISGRSWVNPQGETKYFNSIKGWRIEKVDQEAQQAAVMQASVKPTAFPPATSINEEEPDDLPF